ncbi:VOC family protein [Rhodobacter ferrooxidans]|uniref:Glyoxalase/bleomycin resistance protein/dioxygenase n=1 Tax=Rhodobacter ferrooxidans TaxID=371731 RepID=C8RYD6_9RHOB|nr:VOC family protein [Rhodobacter sp. SW2]EEW26124.1 Glyoxalase/bleomycin resistance protein/dioxygenase [Rhodobacter sp. SW2]
MNQTVFVNLPVASIDRARAFYTALGFSINEGFSSASNICVVVSETIFLMLLDHERFQGFSSLPRADTGRTTAALIALSRDSRDAVDAFCKAALAAGGSETRPPQDHGFMYARTIHDPDGNVFEPFWMEASAT